jgi:hypothetical protein
MAVSSGGYGNGIDSCNLVLYDNDSHTGNFDTFSGDTDLAAGGHHHRDRDHSAKLSGSCKNTSYLVFEHPWDHKGTNGGLAYLVGESDKPGNLWKTGQNDYEKGRYWKRSGQADNIVRINIPSEDVNEGRMREDIRVFGKRTSNNAGDTLLHLYRDNNGNPNASDQWLTGTHNDTNSIKKGTPCPGGDAYWKNAINPEISCVYNVKTGDKLGRIQTLHREQKDSTIANDPRKVMYSNIVTKYCDRAERLEDRVTSGSGVDSTCRAFSNAKALAKEYCKNGDKIATDNTFCTKEELGTALYEELAGKYCEANPDKDFCGCYNVLNNKCLTEENKDLPGCKVTYPTRESINKMPAEYRSNFDGTDKCWGNVCQRSGTGKYVPEGTIDALCSKTVAVCIADLDVGDLQESGVNIEQNCGNNNQTTDGSSGEPSEPSDGSTEGTPAPMGGTPSAPSTPPSVPSTTPLETTTTSTSPSLNEDEEEKAFYEKPEVQIGTVASSLVSIFSCFMLIILAM